MPDNKNHRRSLTIAAVVFICIYRNEIRKQCKYAHTCSKRLLVTIPQTPKILNFVEGLRVQRTLNLHDGRITTAVFFLARARCCVPKYSKGALH